MRENSDQNGYDANVRIDELLNSFIDGELTAAEQGEVERLIAQDVHVVKRLRQLQKCKMLVGSLPRLDVPAEVSEGIRASLARMTVPGDEWACQERAGKRHLLVRRVLSAAAMIGLVAVLAGVLYTIVTPQTPAERPVALEAPKPGLRISASPAFSARLELKTSSLPEVSAFISTAIEENGLVDSSGPARRQDRRVYSLNCSRKDLNLLLANLETIWPELDTATLFVDTHVFDKQVVVNGVRTEQIAQIAGQDNPDTREQMARDLDALNTMVASVPGREILFAIQGAGKNLVREWVPRPVEAGKMDNSRKSPSQAEEEKTVRVTIIVNW
jgi:anti-sigma factor RsiW